MSNPKISPKMSVKVMINKQKTKVLYTEATGDFVDVLLSFLTLPLGKIMRILEHHYKNSPPSIGSLHSLYKSLHHLDSNQHFCVEGAKEMFLNPRNPFEADCSRLILDITDSHPNKYFVCQENCCDDSGVGSISMYSGIATCFECGKLLNKETDMWHSLAYLGGLGVFAHSSSTFLISDDLRVVPVESGLLQTPAVARALYNLGVMDTEGAELRSLSFGFDDFMDLLKLSLISATPMTDLIINDGKGSVAAKPEAGVFLHQFGKHADSAVPKKMTLKVTLQRSTNRFLFTEATDEFLEFLFSFLIIPLGEVEHFLGGKTNLKSIDNLYRSVMDFIDNKHFKKCGKIRLINPRLAYGYTSGCPFLPLVENIPPKIYKSKGGSMSLFRSIRWRGGQGDYVKKPTMCYVTDDLTVTPSLASTISILNGFGIVLWDVKEMDLHIGMEEAFSILKASLTSKTAFTDGLINPMLYKPPKLEKKSPKLEKEG